MLKLNLMKSGWPIRVIKLIGSVLIVLHLTAIVVAPASVPPTPTSITKLFYIFEPYLQAAYLNHGYHYFAPDPGSSSLMEYTVLDEQNRKWSRFPDRNLQRPRLLYHRYFMLTEFYAGIHPSNVELRQSVVAAYAQQIANREDADGVWIEMTHVTHNLSTREEIIQGGELTAPNKYEYVSLGRFLTGAGSVASGHDRATTKEQNIATNESSFSEMPGDTSESGPSATDLAPAAVLQQAEG